MLKCNSYQCKLCARSTEILAEICEVLDCDFCDIIELVREEPKDVFVQGEDGDHIKRR